MSPEEVLKKFKRIAVIGMSPTPNRASHYVASHMIDAGYEISGVNPGHTEILGRPVVPTIGDLRGPLEIVAIFRSSEYLAEIVRELIPLRPKVLWIQLDIFDPESEKAAEDSGMIVIRRRCLMVEERNLH